MAVLPGNLPLTLNRGTAFDSFILRLTDQNVTVSGTISPNISGAFLACGKYENFDLFVQAGTPATFLYYNVAATSYVIARLLTSGALTDYWTPTVPITTPTGTYLGHGANTGTATVTNHPVDLSGYTPQAQVRRQPLGGLILTLDATVTDDVGGEITFAAITDDDTRVITSHGNFYWDLVLATINNRFGPYVKGSFTISDNITQAGSSPPTPP
jgi:hypothetical protein